MRTIIKYKNRKLYDTETSRYITLNEVLCLYNEFVDDLEVRTHDGYDITIETVFAAVVEDKKYDLDFKHSVIKAVA